MSEEIDRLWTLRGLDEEVVAIQATLARIPEHKREVEARVGAERVRLDRLKAHLTELQLKRRELEREIGTVSEQERKFQSQLPAVKKNEEYTALLHEIGGAKARRSDLETEVLIRMEEEEKENAERPEREKALQAAERDAAERVRTLEGEEAVLRERLAALERERAAELEPLAPAVRNRYERIRASREGRAVVPILRGSCGGCFRGQPPQVLQEARRRDRVLNCDGCGRMLVWPPEAA